MSSGRRDDEAARPRPSGGPILRALLVHQRVGLIMGMLVGLVWSAGKVAVPKLRRGLDHSRFDRDHDRCNTTMNSSKPWSEVLMVPSDGFGMP